MVSPYETLQPRRMRRGPLRSNEMTDILQSIRPHWEVDFPVNVSIDIDQTLCDALGIGIVAFRQCRYRSWLVTPVMIDWRLRVLLDLVYELLPHMTFVLVRISPE